MESSRIGGGAIGAGDCSGEADLCLWDDCQAGAGLVDKPFDSQLGSAAGDGSENVDAADPHP